MTMRQGHGFRLGHLQLAYALRMKRSWWGGVAACAWLMGFATPAQGITLGPETAVSPVEAGSTTGEMFLLPAPSGYLAVYADGRRVGFVPNHFIDTFAAGLADDGSPLVVGDELMAADAYVKSAASTS